VSSLQIPHKHAEEHLAVAGRPRLEKSVVRSAVRFRSRARTMEQRTPGMVTN
jgi:hypothetical protein